MTTTGGPFGGPMSGTERFAERLRALTWDDHERAASSDFVGALFDGTLPTAGYTALVAQHYFAYVTLEGAAATMATDPVAGAFVFDELARLPALEADLRYLVGDDWATRIAPSAATLAYCARMRDVAYDWAGGFVAHHYTRYLGDLSGGQFIADAVARTYELDDGEGVQFYRFDTLGDLDTFKRTYRELLDTAPWDADEQERVIQEMKVAYHHNTEVLAQLDREFTA